MTVHSAPIAESIYGEENTDSLLAFGDEPAFLRVSDRRPTNSPYPDIDVDPHSSYVNIHVRRDEGWL